MKFQYSLFIVYVRPESIVIEPKSYDTHKIIVIVMFNTPTQP